RQREVHAYGSAQLEPLRPCGTATGVPHGENERHARRHPGRGSLRVCPRGRHGDGLLEAAVRTEREELEPRRPIPPWEEQEHRRRGDAAEQSRCATPARREARPMKTPPHAAPPNARDVPAAPCRPEASRPPPSGSGARVLETAPRI